MFSCKLLLHTPGLGGHRASYLHLFQSIFDATRVENPFMMLFSRKPLLFLMLEGAFVKFTVVSIIRKMMCLRTGCLLFRPGPVVLRSTVKMKVKHFILSFLKNIKGISVITILPHSLDSRFTRISDLWIYDPQLWDINKDEFYSKIPSELCGYADRLDSNLVVALGRQDGKKNFSGYHRAVIDLHDSVKKHLHFVVAGKVHPSLTSQAIDFSQQCGILINRFVDDDEINWFYLNSRFVWSSYSIDYDQASGIFGRAIQFNLMPIVREGSYIHLLCLKENFFHLTETEFVNLTSERLLSLLNTEVSNNDNVFLMRHHSVSIINKFIGL